MSCKIIKEREVVTEKEYELAFDDGFNNGFGFPCDAQGNTDTTTWCPEAIINYNWCLEHPEKFKRFNQVIKHTWKYTLPAIARCSCNEEFELTNDYMGATKCPKCGQWYNLYGQALVDPEYWEEDY